MAPTVTPETLLAAGYKEHPTHQAFQYDRLFQKRFRDDVGTMYFITFRHWTHADHESWDAEIATDTASDGYVWATMREATIEQYEHRARAIWEACGSRRYGD